MKKRAFEVLALSLVGIIVGVLIFCYQLRPEVSQTDSEPLKWVDFKVTYQALKDTMTLDITSYEQEVHIGWVDALAYLGAKYGGDFSRYRSQDLNDFAAKLRNGADLEDFTENMKFFSYYQRAYGAVLDGMIGVHKVQVSTKKGVIWKEQYGLKAFSPIAQGYWYTDSDDFGNNRSYGYSRKHFGHDLMIGTGTPVIAVESGTVEAIGWNQYGGWRLGIRTFDKKRYYYYAHLRKNKPYVDNLYVGKTVTAGDVIGYSGQTGYSLTENTNNIQTPHLHYGMQLIFDEKSKDGPNQIWVDMYALTRLFSNNRSEVVKRGDHHIRKYKFSENSYYLAASTPSSKKEKVVPIIMYHSLLKHGQSSFIVKPETFESDLKYLKQHGYTAVFMSDLIRFVEDGRPLPKKPIVLTFDDGYYNNSYYGLSLLEKYDMKAVISVVGQYSESATRYNDINANYSYFTWKQIRDLTLTGRFEFQNHSYNAHKNSGGRNGIKQMPGESDKDYLNFLKKDVLKMQKKLGSVASEDPTTFTYPFGAINEGSDAALKNIGFQATLSCAEGTNRIISGDEDSLFGLKRYRRNSNLPSEDFFNKLLEE